MCVSIPAASSALSRDEKILQFFPLVQTIARRLYHRLPNNVDLDELVSVGTVGLIDSVDRYDPSRGVPLKAYAEIRIKGAMLDSLRRDDWVPRSVRYKHQTIESARKELLFSLRRNPSRGEIAARLEMDQGTFDKFTRDAMMTRLLSLDAPLKEDGNLLVDVVPDEADNAEDSMSHWQLQNTVNNAISRLPEKEQQALSLSFIQGYTLREIGGMMGVSESRVCQIRNRAIKQLRRRLGVMQ